MIQNTVNTLVDYVKDLSGQTNAPIAKIIRALNFGTDHLSTIKLMAGSKSNPDSSNHSDLPSTTVTTSATTLSQSGGDLDNGELSTLRRLEIDFGGVLTPLRTIDTRDADYEWLQNQTGTPTRFDLDGNLIKLLPVPDRSYTYKLTYGRVHPRYEATNLTQATGLLPNEEEYVALYAADRIMIGTSDSARVAVRNELPIKQREIEKMAALKDQSTSKRLKPRANTFTRNTFRTR
jgi:hypothetical protein